MRRPTPLYRLPFWLLIAAWFCANAPQTAAWHVIQWMKDARHFSHQARLEAEVAALLSGEKPAPRPCLAADSTRDPEPGLPIPEEGLVKKIVLGMDAPSLVVLPWHNPGPWSTCNRVGGPAPVADVPHPPPRGIA